MVAFRPGSVGELCEALTEPGACWIEGSGSSASFRVGSTAGARTVRLDGLSEIVDLDPANQVAVVQAGASLQKLQTALETVGHCLPYDPYLGAGTVGGALSMNLPHGLEAKHGSWRDWVLGLTVARPDGKLARCGSRVVKNVAGYDVAKMFVGARGWLGVVAEVILRTFPRPHPPAACLEQGAPLSAGPLWIQRTLPQDAIAAREAAGDRLCLFDPGTFTLVAALPCDESLPRFDGDWVLRRGCGNQNAVVEEAMQRRLMLRAKAIFDPDGKLNPGEWGEL